MQDGHEYCEPGKPMCSHCKAQAYEREKASQVVGGAVAGIPEGCGEGCDEGCKGSCDCGPDLEQAIQEKLEQIVNGPNQPLEAVRDDHAPVNQTELTGRAMTIDEARAAVGRQVVFILRSSIEATEAELAKAKDAGLDGPAEATGRVFVHAAKELHDAILKKTREFERPRILRAPRGLHIVREKH